MTDQETATGGAALDDQDEPVFDYPIKIEDAGPATKKVSIEIPRERIESKLAEQFKELRQQAAIPGFRPGHAPQKLIEKRFSGDVKDQVRRALISESYEQAVEKHSLQVIGEPEFDNPDAVSLPDEGSMTYSFRIEVQPEITLPDMKGLRVRKARISVSDENVQQAMTNLLDQQGTLAPVEDRGVQEKDYLIADVHVRADGAEVAHQHDAQIVARSGRIAGIQVDDLAQRLAGLKPGEKRSFTVTAPEDHANEQFRGKQVEVEVALKDLKRLEAAEVTPAFLEGLGFTSEQELRDALRQQMVERIEFDVKQSMREQVNRYLLEHVKIDLPEKLSDRQAERVVSRRAVDLLMRGIPREQIEANADSLRGGAKEEAARELRLFFILQKVASEQNVDVDEAELNGRIAMIAAQRGWRPEKLKQDMNKDGTLANLYVQLREQKAVDKLLESAEIEEVEVKDGEQKA